MGLEARCRARWKGRSSDGVAHLDIDKIDFRDDAFRISLPFSELSNVEAHGGSLRLVSKRGTLVLELGEAAGNWSEKIRRPRPLLDKLGVKPDTRLVVSGLRDEAFLRLLRERTPDVSTRLRRNADILIYAADTRADLEELGRLRTYLQPAGAIWVVSPRGDARIKDVHVMAAAKLAGLVDTKVVRFSDSHTALKLVIPLAKR